MSCKIVKVAIDGASGAFDNLYSYAVPLTFENIAVPGCRVTLPFGKGNSKRQGLIFSYSRDSDDNLEKKLKELYSVTDTKPALNDEMLKMCEWLKEHTLCTYYDAVRAVLPSGLDYRFENYFSADPEFSAVALLEPKCREIFEYLLNNGEVSQKKLEKLFENAPELLNNLENMQAVSHSYTPVRRMTDPTQRYVKLAVNEAALSEIKLTSRQQEMVRIVTETGGCSIKELLYFTGASQSVINTLIRKGVFSSYEKETFRLSYNAVKTRSDPIILTAEQQKAYEGLCHESDRGQPKASLLYGVTGSGKTKVFLKLVDYISAKGQGVIVMVPEIALTPQIINIFSERYGNKIAVFHSAMSLGKRMDEYKRIKQGKALIAIGTRSAIFAPFSKLGLIIIDEEQEHTYKSERSPRFHTRELAKFRVKYHNALLCLASATPSLETYGAALNGRYSLFCLTQRYGGARLPEVTTVDMRKELSDGNKGCISRVLYEAVDSALKNGKQAIILLNRRGHNTYITCPSCGYVAVCPNCSITLTYHSANRKLMCHYCGYSEAPPDKCPQCDSAAIRFLGIGTQKVEDELRSLFPNSRIVRMDADSTLTRDSYSKYLTAFGAGEYDIMLGTQMVAKGLDFPQVSVVGVIGADHAAHSEDYRGFERTFSLLTQVVGRAGRAGEGKAIIQTVDPESNIISLACRQDYAAFYNEEILTRRVMTFPPFCDICVICIQSLIRDDAIFAVKEIFARMRALLNGEYRDVHTIVLGPAAAAVPKINNRYRFRITVKCRDNKRFRDMLRQAIDFRFKSDISIIVDINPETVI